MKPPILRSAAEKGQNTVDDWPHSLQGIPVMPRMDTGDAFDRILQRWIENGADSVPHSSSQQMDYKDLGLSLPLEPEVSPFLADFPPPLPTHPAAAAHQHMYPPQYHPYGPAIHSSAQQQMNPFQNTHVASQPAPMSLSQSWQGNGGQQARGLHRQLPHSSIPAVVKPNLPDLHSAQRSHMSSLATSTAAGGSTLASSSRVQVNREPSPGQAATSPGQAATSPMDMAPKDLMAQLPAIGSSVEDAQQAWPKRKRGPLSEASKEKERARNRRAQKRFREREKERQEERQSAMSVLEAELIAMKEQKARLEEKNEALEQAMRMRQEQKKYDARSAGFDAQYFVETLTEEPSELLPELTLQTCARKFSEEDVKNLNFGEHKKIYQGYVEELRKQISKERCQDRQDKLSKLVSELCALNLAIAMAKPSEFAKFHVSKLDEDGLVASQVPPETWKRCLEALRLSAEQKKGLLEYRREYLLKLSPLLKQRWELHRLMVTTFSNDKHIGFRTSHAKAIEAVERLNENLRQEQAMLIQSMCANHQQVLAPEQTCIHIVTAYPYYPDVPMLVEAIALETPGEIPAAAILDVRSLPPITASS